MSLDLEAIQARAVQGLPAPSSSEDPRYGRFDYVAWVLARDALAEQDIPALLAHCQAQAAEIERLQQLADNLRNLGE